MLEGPKSASYAICPRTLLAAERSRAKTTVVFFRLKDAAFFGNADTALTKFTQKSRCVL